MDGGEMPIDPDLEDAGLRAGRMGIHRAAKLLGCLKRELLAEGFDEDEAYGLCEAWMLEALLKIEEDEDK